MRVNLCCKCGPLVVLVASMNPDRRVLFGRRASYRATKQFGMCTPEGGDQNVRSSPIMVSSRSLKTTMDAKQGVIKQMGIKYVHNLRGQ
jgi:hypothetical protein